MSDNEKLILFSEGKHNQQKYTHKINQWRAKQDQANERTRAIWRKRRMTTTKIWYNIRPITITNVCNVISDDEKKKEKENYGEREKENSDKNKKKKNGIASHTLFRHWFLSGIYSFAYRLHDLKLTTSYMCHLLCDAQRCVRMQGHFQ